MIWGVGSNTKLKHLLTHQLPRKYTVPFHPKTDLTPKPSPIAASLKAWNKKDCHPRQAILDSGASDHFMPMSYRSNHKKLTNREITVTCANGGQLISTATDIINFHEFPMDATKCHKFPNYQLVDPLFSLGKLTEHGCNVTFKRDTVEVTDSDGITILVGQKTHWEKYLHSTTPLGETSTHSSGHS